MFDFNVVPLSRQIWPRTWLLNFWAATGVPSLLNESFGTEPATLGKICRLAQVERATSATPRLLKHIALARWHRAGSIFLNEKNEKKLENIEPSTSR